MFLIEEAKGGPTDIQRLDDPRRDSTSQDKGPTVAKQVFYYNLFVYNN